MRKFVKVLVVILITVCVLLGEFMLLKYAVPYGHYSYHEAYVMDKLGNPLEPIDVHSIRTSDGQKWYSFCELQTEHINLEYEGLAIAIDLDFTSCITTKTTLENVKGLITTSDNRTVTGKIMYGALDRYGRPVTIEQYIDVADKEFDTNMKSIETAGYKLYIQIKIPNDDEKSIYLYNEFN